MQSILHNQQIVLFPKVSGAIGPLTRLRQWRMFLIYAGLYGLAAFCVLAMPNSVFTAIGHSLALPGTGFLSGWSFGAGAINADLILGLLSLSILGFAGFLWFATGNIILLPLLWAAAALISGFWQAGKPSAAFAPCVTGAAFAAGPIIIALLLAYQKLSLHLGQSRRESLNQKLSSAVQLAPAQSAPQKDELTYAQLQHMRLLLDRALQPVEDFEGFEWLDQFQTAAVRYQINFISYALSIAQADFMPDFTGYISKAQRNLRAKQENHRIWKYWKLENIWGNLRLSADPIAQDNIMYSGFVGAQLAWARQACPRDAAALDGLKCKSKTSEFAYSQNDIMQVLVSQYEEAKYGLLSCEPNWVYPLCNAITATAILANDTQNGTQHWARISDDFRAALETEFITPSGRFIPFRSNYTGFAPPPVGGAVMQAFPCFFLNAVMPDIARRQWTALKLDMEGKSWRRTLWPADVGNYSFSRASSYAATALAAREMGDDETADLLLGYLESDCPITINGGVAHYSKASLWANANAFMARIGRANGLQGLVTTAQGQDVAGLYLAKAEYSDVLIAKAKTQDGVLSLVLYPAGEAGIKPLTIAGLIPNAAYKLTCAQDITFTARADGTHEINALINGRTEITITPIL